MTIFDSVRMKCRTLLEAVNELFAMGGELEQKVDNQEEELVNMQSVMGDVQTGFSEVRAEMETLTDRVDTVEQTYDPAQLVTIKSDIASIEGDIQLLTAGVNGTQSRMDDVEESNAQAVATVQELSETVSGYDTEIANLKTTDTNTMQQVITQGVRIDNEITARESGDTALRQVLETEVQTRSDQVNTLTSNLNDEVTARTNADTTMQGALDTLDAGVVKLTGAQTVAGQKTFTSTLVNQSGFPCIDLRNTAYTTGTPPSSSLYWITSHMVDNMNNNVANVETYVTPTEERIFRIGTNKEGAWQYPLIIRWASDYSDKSVSVPTPSSTSDNSSNVATTQWVNTASSVVHTTGTETIAGVKNFTSPLYVISTQPLVNMNIPGLTKEVVPSSPLIPGLRIGDKDAKVMGGCRFHFNPTGVYSAVNEIYNVTGEVVRTELFITPDGEKYFTAPATRTTGYGTNDVATAGWVDAKLQALEARITALEGGA